MNYQMVVTDRGDRFVRLGCRKRRDVAVYLAVRQIVSLLVDDGGVRVTLTDGSSSAYDPAAWEGTDALVDAVAGAGRVEGVA